MKNDPTSYQTYVSEFEDTDGLKRHRFFNTYEEWLLFQSLKHTNSPESHVISLTADEFFKGERGLASFSGFRANLESLGDCIKQLQTLGWITLAQTPYRSDNMSEWQELQENRLNLARISISNVLIVNRLGLLSYTDYVTEEIIFATQNCVPIYYFDGQKFIGRSVHPLGRKTLEKVYKKVEVFIENHYNV